MTQKLSLRFLIFTLLITPFLLFSQNENLVPNPSFENFRMIPNDVAQGPQCIDTWTFPNVAGTGEYYHARGTNKSGVLKNRFGKQMPHDGNAYAGICITRRFREYVQVKLKQPLIKNQQYEVVFHVSKADRIGTGSVDEFNVIFSQEAFKIWKNKKLKNKPELVYEGAVKNKKDWTKLSAIYKASGNEQFLTFGSFQYDEDGKEQGKINGLIQYAHYYIDDVSVSLINSSSVISDSLVTDVEMKHSTEIEFNVGETYIFENLLFESGESVLLSHNYPDLENLVKYMFQNPQSSIRITGHTDNQGAKNDNQKLSLNRAESVKSYLTKNGIEALRIQTAGKGESQPIVENDNASGRMKNRRVEISFL